MEEWREIAEFPNYQISDRGNVRRLTPNRGAQPGRLLDTEDNRVRLIRNERFYSLRAYIPVDILVLLSFRGAPAADGRKWGAAHLDSDPNNNALDNLEWTPLEEKTSPGRPKKRYDEDYQRILRALTHPMPSEEIAQKLRTSKQTARKRLTELVARGYVETSVEEAERGRGRPRLLYASAKKPSWTLRPFREKEADSRGATRVRLLARGKESLKVSA